MKRRWTQLLVLVRTAAVGMRRSAGPTALSVLTIAVALLLAGSFALLVTNMNGLLERAGEQLQIVAYLESGISEQAAGELSARAAEIEGVRGVALVTADEALARFRASAGAEIAEGLDENPLPASLEVALDERGRTPEGLEKVVEAVAALDGVDEIARESDWVALYSRALAYVRTGAWVIGGALALAALLIVGNTIRLAMYARRDEIDILSLVGASRLFVRMPFVLEAFVQGTLGGLIALATLWLAFEAFAPQLESGLLVLLGQSQARFFDSAEMFRLVLAGSLLGALGAVSAMRGLGR